MSIKTIEKIIIFLFTILCSPSLDNIQKAQAGLTRLFEAAKKTSSFYRVMKNDTPVGVLIPNNLWEEITEDLEALSSPRYRARIAKTRKQKSTISQDEVKKQLGL